MDAVALLHTRISYSGAAFAELVVWHLPTALAGSRHRFKYRLAYVVNGVCVVRFDNEACKGDHRHVGEQQHAYVFTTPEQLIADFEHEIARWNHENL